MIIVRTIPLSYTNATANTPHAGKPWNDAAKYSHRSESSNPSHFPWRPMKMYSCPPESQSCSHLGCWQLYTRSRKAELGSNLSLAWNISVDDARSEHVSKFEIITSYISTSLNILSSNRKAKEWATEILLLLRKLCYALFNLPVLVSSKSNYYFFFLY